VARGRLPGQLARGEPGAGYPWSWSIYQWLPGESATLERLNDPCQAAVQLVQFVTALQRVDTTGGPHDMGS
jgi:aminoglycoside phosphotransferase (APT) family kinase protein